ncbi:MFS transporter [Lampropedia cohaerens]|uniref:MFS transporter n=1 Tax=Lampropedia cohaerens TaxID=1610491 RepID=A0A0U1Q3A9_9BURK|nr:MFS transporter [Lampropedia cohaerens]KKW69242.1 MFS transporter [Lampropedia cohaerens]
MASLLGRTGDVWRTPGFGAFLFARMVAVLATQIQAVVVGWQVYQATGEAMSLAWVGLAQFLPMLALLMPAGDMVDRFNRKLLLAASWAVQALCAALLWLLSAQLHWGLGWLYAVLVLFGCARAFTGPALQSLLPQIVPRAQLAQALATNSMLMRAAAIGGPVVGGLLYAWGDAQLAYGVCLLCLTVGTLLLARVPVRFAAQRQPDDGSPATTMWQRFAEGIVFIRNHPIILGTISLDLFAVLLGGVVALLPIYASEVLKVGPDGLGLLRSAMGAGEVMAGLYLARRPFNRRVGLVMFGAVAVFGLANLVFSLSHWFWLSFAMLWLAGAADMVSVYIRQALVQFATPDHMRGRVNAVNMLFVSSSNELGSFRAGAGAAWMGAVGASVLGSVSTLAIVAAWMARFPSLRRADTFEQAAKNHR